jgi:hypothetical protein
MRIAFDLDGVLADLHTPFTETAIRLFPQLDLSAMRGPDVAASPGDDARDTEAPTVAAMAGVPINHRQSDAVWKHLAGVSGFWEGLAEIEAGAIRRLAQLADERRWDVLFITSRPSTQGLTVQRQSQRWLERMGFTLPSVYVVHGSRGRVAAALNLDVVIDDRPDNCLDVVLESKAGAVLIWRGAQAAVPVSAKRLGIAVSHTVADCLDLVTEAEDTKAEGSLLDKMRRVFGLKTRKSPGILRRTET